MRPLSYSTLIILFLILTSCSEDDNMCIDFNCLTTLEKNRVIEFVDSASSHLETYGPETAFNAFSYPSNLFIENELYIFVVDISTYDEKEAVVVAHGFQPELISQNLFYLQDIQGTYIVQGQKASTDNELQRGWSEFYWDNPETNELGKKFAYIVRKGNLLIGSGTYR